MKKLIISTLLSLLLPLVANAYDAEIDGIYYNFSGDEATVTYRDNNYNSYSGAIVIPESVTYNSKTYSVTSIGERAFSGCSGLTSITIPNSVTSIGSQVFQGCSGLTSVTIGSGVTKIGEYAFSGCSGLTAITIPNSVTSIGNSAFSYCEGLTSVTIGKSVTSIGENAFYRCSNLTSVTLESDAIVSASRYAQTSMKSLFGNQVTKYVIGNAVTSIGNCAFYECSGMTEITIPNSVTSIGGSAFYGCSCLTTIRIPNSVTSIGERAFSGCSGLTSVQISDLSTWVNINFNNSGSNPLNYAHHLYLNGSEIKDLVIPTEISSIGQFAFSGCSGLTSVTIPSSVTNIGEYTFQNCPKLKHIYVTSQIPADCSGAHTFYCSTDYARNNYDVYDYAILHVPMGTKEEYAIAYEWRYFAKIKEDLDINGQVFYTTLSVNHAGDGYVKHYVKADEPYTLYIGSEEGMRINTVLYNGEDVTDKLVDGYYTTPNITRPSKIVVSFEQDPDGVADIPAENNLHVYGNDGSLFVSGIEEPQQMFVYTLNGMLINSQTLESDTRIKMSEGTYIVKVGERTFKVLL